MKYSPIIAASLCGLSSLHAQSIQSPAPNKLPELVVKAERKKRSLTTATVEESRKELAKTPGAVEVVDAERFLQGRASTVADTFALSPGVFAQSRFGSDEARLSIRGSGLQRTFHGRGIRVMQDGVPLNLADGGFDFQALEPLATSHIDVWRGANALAYGSSSLGGAINYVSRTGRTDPGVFSRLEAGSYGYFRGTLAGGLTSGSSDLYGSFSHQSQNGFRDHAEQSNQRLFANFGQQLTEDAETRFYLSAVHSDSELPGNLFKRQIELDPRQAAPANITGDQKRDFDLLRIANRTTLKNGDTTYEFAAAWTHKDLDHPIFQVIDQNSNDFLLGLTATHDSPLVGHDNQIRGGVLYTVGLTDAANYVNVGGHRGNLVANADQVATNLEGFIEDQFSIGNGFTLIAGATASWNRRDNDQTFGPGRDYALDYTNVSPKLGFRWDGPDMQVYGNVSGSYEPPSFSETLTLNTAREDQTGTTVELGTRGEHGPLRWDASVYHAEIRDELLAIVDPLTLLTSTINANRTTHSGVEFGGEVDLLGSSWKETPDHRLVLRSAWTYGDFRFDGDPRYGDNQIAGVPQHIVRGELLWQHAEGWYAGPTFEWVPVKAFIDHRNTFAADPYAICGFKFGRRMQSGLSWFIEARNLTDEKFTATTGVIENAGGVDQRQFLPGDGRSVFGGIEWKW